MFYRKNINSSTNRKEGVNESTLRIISHGQTTLHWEVSFILIPLNVIEAQDEVRDAKHLMCVRRKAQAR